MEVKSINDRPKRMLIREQTPAPGPVGEAPKVATEAVPEPAPTVKLTKLFPERIVGMTIFKDRVWVATETGVYIADANNVFKRLSLVQEDLEVEENE